MTGFMKSRAGRQFAVLAVLSLSLFTLGVSLEIHNLLYGLMSEYDNFGMKQMVLAMAIASLCSFAFSALRIMDLNREMQVRIRAQESADWMAMHDNLTRLPNRYALERRRQQHAASVEARERAASPTASDADQAQDGEPPGLVTVYSVNLNGFKRVNDLHGHQGGDALLTLLAKRLQALGGANNVFRISGDDFFLVLQGQDEAQDQLMANLLIQAIGRPIRINGVPAEVGASIGYARAQSLKDDLADITRRADLAMHEAKALGRNRTAVYDPAMQDKAAERAHYEARLRGAIRAGEIVPHYQPLINLKTGDICGFEALARWTDTSGRSVPPPVFIAIAEETGLITELFETLLSRACHDAASWPSEVTLSFNISPVQMKDPLLASRILKIIHDAGLDASRLEVEITENALIEDPELASGLLKELHAAGIQIALDDFGTGYSSLSQLARYRFDKIKIDKSFIATHDDERQDKIVLAMLSLGRSLNVAITAEGIEQHQQLAYLLAHGCDIGQGYLFGKAMPASQASAYIAERQAAGQTA
ncbi:diguanylate cyclase [Xaviernesmea oryzae]|uniref:Diguanylate cyclase n=1 Tax=Xaviernesmea oryzae TaxID=464029 RepID=A0A1Q9AUP4_9HYPH|nr:bifunctional diguanylate cyclase/phosphodiesterase [Xaviernesmea oryzae]OLP59187.1 diguanylate cyclase [Xaviernesmea oryzae]SEK82612.1 diguanylate cyclase (GGDEF) domain-containing protein [Xaviernesmea oryzae]